MKYIEQIAVERLYNFRDPIALELARMWISIPTQYCGGLEVSGGNKEVDGRSILSSTDDRPTGRSDSDRVVRFLGVKPKD